jgi:cyclase
MIELAKGIFVETETFGSNNAIIATGDGLVLMDAPYRPTDALRWREFASSLGVVRYVINTDHHADHTVGNGFFAGEVVSHRLTRERLQTAPRTAAFIDEVMTTIDPEGRHLLAGYRPKLASLTFETRMSMHVGGRTLELIHMPGHAPGGTVVLLPEEGILFAGDLVCEASLPGFSDADLPAWLAALARIELLDVRHLVPGHGAVCGRSQVGVFRAKMQELMDAVAGRIDRGETREQIAEEVVYEDGIHGAVGGSAGYPKHIARETMRRAVRAVYDNILRMRDQEQ